MANRPTPGECTVGIAGFGTVGRAVARILASGAHPGVQLTHVCNRNVVRKRVDWAGGEVVWTDSFQALIDSPVDVIVELIGGQDPARSWIEQALAAGKSVVTANKQVIAQNGPALLREAGRQGRHLLFEAAVAGGIPILRGLRDGVAGDRLRRIQGILNGTCNYILTRMECAGLSFEEALSEARRLGYAEADPSADVDGYDAQAKLAILVGVGLGRVVDVDDIPVEPITPVAAIDFVYARRLGCVIRQVATAELVPGGGGGLHAAVQPALVPEASALARVDGSRNIVVVDGEFGGETAFSGFGAGGAPTAVAVVSDLMAIRAPERAAGGRLAAGDRGAVPGDPRVRGPSLPPLHDQRPSRNHREPGPGLLPSWDQRRCRAAGAGLAEERAAVRHDPGVLQLGIGSGGAGRGSAIRFPCAAAALAADIRRPVRRDRWFYAGVKCVHPHGAREGSNRTRARGEERP